MAYWLDLFTPHTWSRFREHGATVSGFRPRQRKTAYEKIRRGDIFVCYLVKLSRWCGVLEIDSDAFEDATPIFSEENDPFIIRFRVKPMVVLDYENCIPIDIPEIWQRLSITKHISPGAFGWGQTAGLRQSLVALNKKDGELLVNELGKQSTALKKYPLDAADRRNIERTVVRTERGEVEVEVPDRVEPGDTPDETQPEFRESITRQAQIAELGAALGFTVWIPPSDRARVNNLLSESARKRVLQALPVNFDAATNKVIGNIDVIWLQRRAIIHAFEIEHTTAIYSGLLRMADLLAMQPRINIGLHIVAPAARRDDVRREILRPVFSVLEGGPMAERCSFISYDDIDALRKQPNLNHMRETILDEYAELFVE